MDAEKRSLVATALVGLVVLAIIIGSIYYLIQFIRNRQTGTTVQNTQVQASVSPRASASAAAAVNPAQQPQGGQVAGDFKTYNAGSYQITYPKNWGLLTCSNSENIELDPTNSQDSLNVDCSVATKPITIIKNATGCTNGEMADLGQVKVSRTKANDGDYTRYEWCAKTVPPLYITHRVSGDNSPATSKDDLSRQVEEMISRISFVQGS